MGNLVWGGKRSGLLDPLLDLGGCLKHTNNYKVPTLQTAYKWLILRRADETICHWNNLDLQSDHIIFSIHRASFFTNSTFWSNPHLLFKHDLLHRPAVGLEQPITKSSARLMHLIRDLVGTCCHPGARLQDVPDSYANTRQQQWAHLWEVCLSRESLCLVTWLREESSRSSWLTAI